MYMTMDWTLFLSCFLVTFLHTEIGIYDDPFKPYVLLIYLETQDIEWYEL